MTVWTANNSSNSHNDGSPPQADDSMRESEFESVQGHDETDLEKRDDPTTGTGAEQVSSDSSNTNSAAAAAEGDSDSNAGLQEVVANWSGNTSIHGIAWMMDESSNAVWHRCFWLVLTICGAGIMVWQIEALLSEYRKYEVITDTNFVWPQSMEMPDVTVCNLNPLHAKKQQLHNITEPKNETELRLVTQERAEFIFQCQYNGVMIPNEELPSFWTEAITNAGRCYTFHTDEHVRLPNLDGGLECFADIDQMFGYKESTPFAGLNVFIAQHGELINSQQNPFVVAKPGRLTMVRITNTFHLREREAPWTRCGGKAPEHTMSKCRAECVNQATRDLCGCRVFADPNPDLRYCTGQETEDCQNEHGIAAIGDCLDECLPACEEKQYSIMSQENEFSKAFLRFFVRQFNLTGEVLLENIVGFHVNYESIKYEESTETKAMTFNELLANIGGSMGLFLGISVLSFVELADLAFIRLLPRLCGVRHLFGIGGKKTKTD